VTHAPGYAGRTSQRALSVAFEHDEVPKTKMSSCQSPATEKFRVRDHGEKVGAVCRPAANDLERANEHVIRKLGLQKGCYDQRPAGNPSLKCHDIDGARTITSASC
jgi:hypothetical protein